MSAPILFGAIGGRVYFRGRQMSPAMVSAVAGELRERGIACWRRRERLIWCRYFAEIHAAQREAGLFKQYEGAE